MIDDPELRQLFNAESQEHLARLDDGLLRLEKDLADQAQLEEVFRESHSLKGAARMLGLVRIEAGAHDLESILNAARKGETPLTAEMLDRLGRRLTDLRGLVQEALAEAPTNVAVSAPTVPSVPPQPAVSGGKAAQSPNPRPQTAPPQPVAPSVGPPRPPAPDGNGTKGATVPPPRLAPAALGSPFHIETVRVETRQLDELLTQVGELAVLQGRGQHRLGLLEELLEQWALLTRDRRGQNQQGAEAPARFGGLLQEARNALYDDSARLEATVNLLGDQVRAIRLLPFSTIFTLFPRMVHDLARELGKEVELLVEGGEITVDKRILEEMKDPLMHLIRNAIDHGIESPVERERQGKKRCGSLRLRAVREDGQMLLEVGDDGRGLDLEGIRRNALKHNLHDEKTLAAMEPATLQQLIFRPGFSTSALVTELSGHGVGLDVVRVNVERLKGTIRLDSQAGQGLLVQVRLPLSLATTRLLLAGANGRLFGVPLEFVHTTQQLRAEELFPLEGYQAIKLGDRPLLAPRLAELLKLPARDQEDGTPDCRVCIVLQVGEEQLGVLVDELRAEEEVVPKPFGAPLRRVPNVSALAILGSGEICALLNPGDLLRTARRLHATPAGARGERDQPAAKSVVLLVEDSALIRAMEKRILEDAGYDVIAAVDGLDALAALGRQPVAAVVSDIVMPNLDGLALTARIRAEPYYRELPVILVTTLASDEDKRRGLEAGANAYIPKPTFDQRVLLDTLRRLIAI